MAMRKNISIISKTVKRKKRGRKAGQMVKISEFLKKFLEVKNENTRY